MLPRVRGDTTSLVGGAVGRVGGASGKVGGAGADIACSLAQVTCGRWLLCSLCLLHNWPSYSLCATSYIDRLIVCTTAHGEACTQNIVYICMYSNF